MVGACHRGELAGCDMQAACVSCISLVLSDSKCSAVMQDSSAVTPGEFEAKFGLSHPHLYKGSNGENKRKRDVMIMLWFLGAEAWRSFFRWGGVVCESSWGEGNQHGTQPVTFTAMLFAAR